MGVCAASKMVSRTSASACQITGGQDVKQRSFRATVLRVSTAPPPESGGVLFLHLPEWFHWRDLRATDPALRRAALHPGNMHQHWRRLPVRMPRRHHGPVLREHGPAAHALRLQSLPERAVPERRRHVCLSLRGRLHRSDLREHPAAAASV